MTKNTFFENWFKPAFGNTMPTQLPSTPFDMKDLMEASRKSIQACSDAQQIAMESFQTIMQRQAEIMSQFFQDNSSIAKEIMAEGTPEEKIARGAELIRDSYEKAMCGAREVGDIANKSAREACDILNSRVTACLDEIKSTAEENKEQKSKKSAKKAA